jgi:hypothetical protein
MSTIPLDANRLVVTPNNRSKLSSAVIEHRIKRLKGSHDKQPVAAMADDYKTFFWLDDDT